jgi:hypothetical protein
MRILISYEQSYHVYSDVLERVIRGLRPEAEVASCSLSEIGEQCESFDPHLVVSTGPTTLDPVGGQRGTGSLPSPTNRPKPRLRQAALGEAQPISEGSAVVHR